jgi:hypothetical protein
VSVELLAIKHIALKKDQLGPAHKGRECPKIIGAAKLPVKSRHRNTCLPLTIERGSFPNFEMQFW